MTTLRLFITSDTPLTIASWLLLDSQWATLRNGNSVDLASQPSLASLPSADQVEVVIPADWVTIIQQKLPAGFHKLQYSALPYLVEDHLITSAEQAHVVLLEKQSDQMASFAAMDKQRLDSLLNALKTYNIYPRCLIPDVLMPALPMDGWTMVLDAPHTFVKTASDSGFSVEGSYETPPFSLILALQDAQTRQSMPTEIRLHTSTSMDVEAWQKLLTQEGFPTKLSVHNQSWHAQPLPAFNLLQGPYTPDSGFASLLTGLKPALMMFVAAIALSVIASLVDIGVKTWKKQTLDHNIQQLFASTFPNVSNIVDAPLQMHRALQDLQHGVGTSGEQDVLPLLAQIADHGLGAARVDAIQFTQEQLTLRLRCTSEREAQQLSESLVLPGRITVIENMQPVDKGVTVDLAFKLDGE